MKKTVKKLVLGKETVRSLTLRQVVGEGTEATGACVYTAGYVCASATCEFTCNCNATAVILQPQSREC